MHKKYRAKGNQNPPEIAKDPKKVTRNGSQNEPKRIQIELSTDVTKAARNNPQNESKRTYTQQKLRNPRGKNRHL